MTDIFEGWASFAGEEIFNADRLAAYLNAGLFPAGAVINACDECGNLARGLGDQEYRSPALDAASWTDEQNPDSYEFAGVMPLEITGVNGSTRIAEVVEFAGDGGVVRKPRYGTRTVAVTALLVGRTTASVEAGLTWLSTVLSGGSGCAPGCLGDDLCFLSYCPDLDEIEDFTQSPAKDPISYLMFEPIDGKLESGGIFVPYVAEDFSRVTAHNWVAQPLGPTSTAAGDWAGPGGLPASALPGGGARVTATASGGGVVSLPVGASPPAGTQVTFSAQGRSSQTTDPMQAGLTFFDTGGAILPGIGVTIDAGASSDWTSMSVTDTVPDGAVTMGVRYTRFGGFTQTGETTDIRQVMVTEVAGTAFFDGDTAVADLVSYRWAGPAQDSISEQVTADPAPVYDPHLRLRTPIPCYTDATFGITISSVSGPVSWHLEFTDSNTGELLHRSATRTTTGSQNYALDVPPEWTDWVVSVYPHNGVPIRVGDIYVSHRPVSNPALCFDDATITYGNTVCVSGPTVTDKMAFSCGETLYKVEWTWVAGNPFAQGRTTKLIDNMNLITGAATRKAYEVISRNPRDVSYANTVCAPVIETYRPGLTDPCCSGWILPPSAPTLVDDCFDAPTSFARTEMWIPPRYAPGNGWGALTITIDNDSRMKRGLRMRVYPDPLGRGLDLLGAVTPSKQECQFCEEWWFTYVAADSTTVVDGVHSRIYTQKTGYQDINSAANVRGRNGGPFGFPVIDCSAGYLLVVDLPKTYPFDCGNYDKGESQGNAHIDVSITVMGL